MNEAANRVGVGRDVGDDGLTAGFLDKAAARWSGRTRGGRGSRFSSLVLYLLHLPRACAFWTAADVSLGAHRYGDEHKDHNRILYDQRGGYLQLNRPYRGTTLGTLIKGVHSK
jgi:hypothetical protein